MPVALIKRLRERPRVLVAFLIVVLCAAGAVARLQLSTDDALSGLKAEQLHNCRIENISRALDNASHDADYQVDLFVEERFSIPTKTETAAQKQITAEFASKLQAAVADKTWATLTNCTAGNSDEIEVFPISQGPPPAYATSLVNAQRPDPVGSIP